MTKGNGILSNECQDVIANLNVSLIFLLVGIRFIIGQHYFICIVASRYLDLKLKADNAADYTEFRANTEWELVKFAAHQHRQYKRDDSRHGGNKLIHPVKIKMFIAIHTN